MSRCADFGVGVRNARTEFLKKRTQDDLMGTLRLVVGFQ
jgi:hypothetical protein